MEELGGSREEGAVLEVGELHTEYANPKGVVRALNGVSFKLGRGEVLGLVGEDGAGKTTLAYSVLRLLPRHGRILSGQVLLEGEDLLQKSEREMRGIRGKTISMVFADPLSSLNPCLTIGDQVAETASAHLDISRKGARERAIQVLSEVGIPHPSQLMDDLPKHFSGGMRQRVVIATALICEPKVIIADEPTTSLDVTIQAQVLDLMRRLIERMGTSLILIANNLGVVSQMCQRIALIYGGQIVEYGGVDQIVTNPLHAYTQALFRALPEFNLGSRRLARIPGRPAEFSERTSHCAFAPRCPQAMAHCGATPADMVEVEANHWVRCLRYGDGRTQ
jgi:oligopeptide/dipeptide ABC transporter ATP-binding protein